MQSGENSLKILSNFIDVAQFSIFSQESLINIDFDQGSEKLKSILTRGSGRNRFYVLAGVRAGHFPGEGSLPRGKCIKIFEYQKYEKFQLIQMPFYYTTRKFSFPTICHKKFPMLKNWGF